jgi:hypothetical protein
MFHHYIKLITFQKHYRILNYVHAIKAFNFNYEVMGAVILNASN